jgi:hypothetical protein
MECPVEKFIYLFYHDTQKIQAGYHGKDVGKTKVSILKRQIRVPSITLEEIMEVFM